MCFMRDSFDPVNSTLQNPTAIFNSISQRVSSSIDYEASDGQLVPGKNTFVALVHRWEDDILRLQTQH